MLPGPVIVNKCPSCSGLVKQRTIASGNTFGAKRWTDGEFKARMLPSTPLLIKCGHCRNVSLRNDFQEVDSFDSYLGFLAFSEKASDKKLMADAKQKQLQYESLPFYEEPSSEEIIHFVTTSEITKDQELYSRVRAWRKWNDSRRDDDNLRPFSENEQKNLTLIIKLLEGNSEAKLVLAEAYRELGQLDQARNTLLTNIFSVDEEMVVEFLLELIANGDTQVCLITEDDEREWRVLRRVKIRNNPNPDLPEYDQSGPAVFTINSREWWFKPVEMLVHNWALVEKNVDKTATVYFFHDLGTTKNHVVNHKLFQLKGRCAVVDSLNFENVEMAEYGLNYNGFKQLNKKAGPWDGNEPFGTFYDARKTEDGIYSKLGFWEKIS